MSDDGTSPDSVETEETPVASSSTLPKLIMLGVIISVVALTFLVLWGGRDELRVVKVGYPAPDFTFRDLDHKEVSLSDYKGKVVLLNLWSITCPSCIDENPYFESLFQKMKGNKDFHLLTVVTNRGETEREVAPFAKKHGLNFHILVDNKKVAWKRYKMTGWPETFLLDRDGIIVEKFIGPRDWSSPAFVRKIEKLIKG